MDRQLTLKRSNFLWRKATKRLDSILDQYKDLPKGVHAHTDSRIFPSAAAYCIIENAAIKNTTELEHKLARMMKNPGMAGLFVRMWDPVSRRMFGESCGFKNVFYPKEKNAYRMDIVECPYNRYFTELGCTELTKIFCENDDRMYGNLPGLMFIRTGTLGKGAQTI